MNITLTINKNSEQTLLYEINDRFEKLKEVAYKNKNQTLVDEINSIYISWNHWTDFSEDTFLN